MKFIFPDPFSEKYELNVGDIVTLDEKYENKQYTLRVAGIYDKCVRALQYLCRLKITGRYLSWMQRHLVAIFQMTEITDLCGR